MRGKGTCVCHVPWMSEDSFVKMAPSLPFCVSSGIKLN